MSSKGTDTMNPKPWPILTSAAPGYASLNKLALPAPLRARKPWAFTVGDVFALPPEQCAAAFGVMAATPQHTYTVEAGPGAAGWFEWVTPRERMTCNDHADDMVGGPVWKGPRAKLISGRGWPLPNVHLSTPPCSTQAELDERAPWALRCPAAARVLRLVPTEGLDVRNALAARWECACPGGVLDSLVCDDRNGCPMCPGCGFKLGGDGRPRIDLVTLRGNTAPLHPDWVRSVRDQCAAAGVAFRFDGWGEWCPREHPYVIDDAVPRVRLTVCGCNGQSDIARHGVRGSYTSAHECDTSNDSWMNKVGAARSGRLLDGVTHDGEVPTC